MISWTARGRTKGILERTWRSVGGVMELLVARCLDAWLNCTLILLMDCFFKKNIDGPNKLNRALVSVQTTTIRCQPVILADRLSAAHCVLITVDLTLLCSSGLQSVSSIFLSHHSSSSTRPYFRTEDLSLLCSFRKEDLSLLPAAVLVPASLRSP